MTRTKTLSYQPARWVLNLGIASLLFIGAASQAFGQDVSAAERTASGQGYLPVLSGVDRSAETSWHLAGYADASFVFTDQDGGDSSSQFTRVRFNPAFHFQYQDLVLFEAEAEIENTDEGTEFALEYAQANIMVHPNAVVVIGQFLSPVGQFQERLHPSWINRMADAPAGFGHDGVQPGSDMGVMVRGGFNLEPGLLTYSVALGNGPRVSHEGGLALEAFNRDDNDDKAISGRVGFLPMPGLEIGASFLSGRVSGVAAEEEEGGHAEAKPFDRLGSETEVDDHGLELSDADVTLWGIDAAYTGGAWDLRAEYLNSTRDTINTGYEGAEGIAALPELESTAWYLQAAYRLSGTAEHPWLGRVEPTMRYGEYEVDGLDELAEEAAEQRWDIGVNYWLAPSIVTRGVLQQREFTARHDDDVQEETRVLLQFSYGF